MKDLHARIPIDRTASRVVSKGAHYEYIHDGQSILSDLPIPIKFLPFGRKDYTGTRLGRFFVIGFYGIVTRTGESSKGANSRKWVVRCVCGMYSTVKEKTIRKYANKDCDFCCSRCYNNKKLSGGSAF